MSNQVHNCFAIVPAAGHSRRMGCSKLLLPWSKQTGGDLSIIDRVLDAWTGSQVAHTVVVIRRADHDLRQACERWPVSIVTPETDPKDMKESIQIGLRHLAAHAAPRTADHCFIAPADLPTLTAPIIDSLIRASIGASIAPAVGPERIIVPRFGDRYGHPALLPWPLTDQIFSLAENEGVNRIVDRHEKLSVLFSAEKRVVDVDTPEQYEQLLRKSGTK